VVLEVEVLGEQFKIPEQVAPRYRKDIPADLAMGKYNKYRSDKVRVKGIVGIATFSWLGTPASLREAEVVLHKLNQTLVQHGKRPMRLTGIRLERLRDDGFNLWELEEKDDVDLLQRIHVELDANIFTDLAPSNWRDQVERTIMRAVGSLSYVQSVGSGHAEPAKREPLGT
jgi:hypothetical protein